MIYFALFIDGKDSSFLCPGQSKDDAMKRVLKDHSNVLKGHDLEMKLFKDRDKEHYNTEWSGKLINKRLDHVEIA
ncbi:MAG: hypothetical protein KGJ13_11830 [Patescibacteria group bacterium]|nr:hypothetical protein [Patescibacteria group bacterium]